MNASVIENESHLPSLNTANMSNTVRKDTTKDTSDDIAHEPRSVPQWLFRPLVPHCHDDGQPWADRCLGCAQEEADSEQALSIEASRSKHENCTPNDATHDQRNLSPTISCTYTETAMVRATGKRTINAAAGYDAAR